MPSVDRPEKTGPRYWRSLDELAQTPEFQEFLHREFPAGATEMVANGDSRRMFLKIMGASMALAGFGLTGCRRWPEEHIAPFSRRPAGRSPGIPVHYATSRELGGCSIGLLATSYDGRPLKVEGNPLHPTNGNAAEVESLPEADRERLRHGSTDALAQASILDLYDPDRSRGVLQDGAKSSWQLFSDFAKGHFDAVRERDGQGVAILSEATSSPSTMAMKQALAGSMKNARWFEYEPLNDDEVIKGSKLAFGAPWRAQYDFAKAKIVVALDSDFLQNHPASLRYARDFARTRRVRNTHDSMSRLYSFESAMSLTGANADRREPMSSADVAKAAGWLASKLLSNPAPNAPPGDFSGDALETLEHAHADLDGHRGESIVIAGPQQPAEVHLLAHLMNEALGNHGRTIRFTSLGDAKGQVESLRELVDRMNANRVDTLVILGGNPVYTAPADLGFADALARVGTTIHLADYVDETSDRCNWHVNRAHYLEAWGDGRAYDGTVSIVQPIIEPLFDGHSAIEVLAFVTGDDMRQGYDIVQRTFAEMTGVTDFDTVWRRTLHDGVLAGSGYTPERPPLRPTNDFSAELGGLAAKLGGSDGIEIDFLRDASVYDGRFANNGWLQEMPDPLTKLTWDNAVWLAPSTAAGLGVETGDMVTVQVGDASVEAAVLEQPGQAVGTAGLTLGYGRPFHGRICTGAGFDFYPLRTSGGMGFTRGSVQKASGRYKLARTQDHHPIGSVGFKGTQERLPTLVREASLDHFRSHPDFARHATHVTHRLSLWEESHPHQSEGGFDETRFAWGMSIDLSTCTGCSACVVACQAENNIPIVGKEQVLLGREMHWIRIDRYWRFDAENGEPSADRPDGVALQPVACVMCENAPCEQVCPVAATLHDQDGLNVMVYNRCVGTRYCSNNCPYKVRRFNYFDWHRREPRRDKGLLAVDKGYYTRPQAAAEVLETMQFNPEVTVRMRGVMEKCTYCVQRISQAKIEAKNEWTKLPEDEKRASGRLAITDGTVTPACAQACPSEAIVFGDLLDSGSRVASDQKNALSYGMLEELNLKPRTKYMARLTNPGFGDHSGTGSDHAPHAEEGAEHG